MPASATDTLMNPVRYLAAARRLAESGDPAANFPLEQLATLPRPVFSDPAAAREELWALLSLPNRAKGLTWLNESGLLEELIPCWAGNPVRRRMRLDAVDQVHLEAWNRGLSPAILDLICDTHDVVVDQRLNRWALTALATLLAGGDVEDPRTWTAFVRRDLHALGATEAEIVWVTGIVLNFNATLLFLRGGPAQFALRPEWAVAALSTLSLNEPDRLQDACHRADAALSGDTNPLDRLPEDED